MASERWAGEMASLASRPDVGVVGARLLYPDLRVQHAGVCFGDSPGPYHKMRLAARHEAGPAGELALLRRSWAVTGACLALRKSLYFEVGGLDEEAFAVADLVAVMKEGRIEQHGAPQDVRREPRTAFVREFLSQ